ncbi:40S ribosomal protein S18-A [Fusarium oxysporum f. sp. albedinis]|nr:40S ribosomal protein S18-A [Fusarium oxysporum f. sp. albedinis]
MSLQSPPEAMSRFLASPSASASFRSSPCIHPFHCWHHTHHPSASTLPTPPRHGPALPCPVASRDCLTVGALPTGRYPFCTLLPGHFCFAIVILTALHHFLNSRHQLDQIRSIVLRLLSCTRRLCPIDSRT